MTAGLGRGIALAATGVVAGLAIVAAFFGTGDLLKRVRGLAPGETSRPVADLSKGAGTSEPSKGDQAAVAPDKNALAAPGRSSQAETPAAEDKTPRLDVLRVEPSGDAVLAGRGAPKAVIELLRDNQIIARVTADEAGQFAIDSLALPPGNSELTLRSTADGKTTEGKSSAVVVVDKDRKAQPLVAVSEPDKPTRVLSMPTPTVDAGKAAEPARREAARPDAGGKPIAPVKIVSVDAQEGGRLFVSGQGAAWTSLRLYLNDTLVASGRSGADGRVAFTIGRGVRPGGYQIRIDQVEADSGKVANRAQVAFTFPAQLAAKDPVKTASKEPSASSRKPEAQVGQPGAMPSMAAKPPSSDMPASGDARPVASDSEKHAAKEASAKPSASAPGPSPRVLSQTAEVPSPVPQSPKAASSGDAKPSNSDQTAAVFVPEIDTAKIIRGDNLWQISRKSYGDGKRYTVIYEANREQIRDPNLIYPGQIFVMPKEAPAAGRQGANRG